MVTRVSKAGLRTILVKTKKRRGRKRQRWVDALHNDLDNEFERMTEVGVRLNLTSLNQLALHIIDNCASPRSSAKLADPFD